MPPRVKITRDEIIKAGLDIIRRGGVSALNARSVSASLGCSTQPLFSNFSSMEELEGEITVAAYDVYLGFLKTEAAKNQYPRYKAYGMAYIRFAKEERELFKHLFMRDRTNEDTSPTLDFEESVEMIMQACGVTRERAMLMHLELWITVHGIATMLVTSFLPLDEELVSNMLSDVYHGIRARHGGM